MSGLLRADDMGSVPDNPIGVKTMAIWRSRGDGRMRRAAIAISPMATAVATTRPEQFDDDRTGCRSPRAPAAPRQSARGSSGNTFARAGSSQHGAAQPTVVHCLPPPTRAAPIGRSDTNTGAINGKNPTGPLKGRRRSRTVRDRPQRRGAPWMRARSRDRRSHEDANGRLEGCRRSTTTPPAPPSTARSAAIPGRVAWSG